jgi:hypothetical protein
VSFISNEVFAKICVLAQFRNKGRFHAAFTRIYLGTLSKINIAVIHFCRLLAVNKREK